MTAAERLKGLPGGRLGHLVYGVVALLIAVMGWALYNAAAQSRESSAWVDHTLKVLRQISQLNDEFSRAEAAQRGVMLYGDNLSAHERDTMLAAAASDIANLKALTADNPAQQPRIQALEGLIEQRRAMMDIDPKARREAFASPERPLRANEAAREKLSAAIYELTHEMQEEELRLLAARRHEQERRYGWVLGFLGAAVLVFTAVVIPGYIGFFRATRGREQAERRMHDLAETLPGALVQYRLYPDGRSRYEFLSGGVMRLRGFDREAALKDPEVVLGTILENDRPAFVAALREGARTLSAVEHDYRVRGPGGEVRWMHTTAAPRRDPDGSVVFSAHWSDVTEKKALERELRDAKSAADAASRAKSTFLATMSHEIRTPMNGVTGMLELLALTQLDPEQRSTLGVVRESAKSLLRIIDDILDFSKIEAGKMDVRPEPTSIADVIDRVANVYAGNASSKGLVLTKFVDRRLSPAVLVDPLRLQQILNNFVSNSIKFTEKGEVELRADLVERREALDIVKFAVHDTGIGISTEAQAHLFTPFSQAGDGASTRQVGTGLGLSICRRLAELMGGEIALQSEVGVGTTTMLTIALPVADPKAVHMKVHAEGAVHEGSSPPRPAPSIEEAEKDGTLLLLVDDHPINRMVLVRQVNALGYAAESVENGIEALDAWSTGRFAAVITDVNMPEMNGYELAAHIRACETRNDHPRTPLIACTANALAGEAENCVAAGMDDYLAKPIQLMQLRSKLSAWVPIASRPEAFGQGGAAPPPAAGASPIDEEQLREIAAGDAVLATEILLRFHRYNLEDTSLLREALQSGNMLQVAHASHRMKGASRTVGAVDLAAACERLEKASRANDRDSVNSGMPAFHQELDRLNAYIGRLQS
jgi:signal transduction histidine kinase/CHASE3 domain sensor protein/HPt (histidine-containing phosphotransfer) domain-containing protein/ActR/RegA family two-component response regulator